MSTEIGLVLRNALSKSSDRAPFPARFANTAVGSLQKILLIYLGDKKGGQQYRSLLKSSGFARSQYTDESDK